MRLLATLCLLFCLLVTPSLCAEPTLSERLQNNTVILTDGYGHGSGVLFTRDDGETFIWTAAHVADIWMNSDGTYEPIPVRQGDKEGLSEVVRVGDYEAGVDVALLRVTEGDFKGDATFYRGFNEMEVGQKVVICGTPLDQEWNERLIGFGRMAYIDRLVDGPPLLAPRRIDQVDITAYPGNSGGPVIDEATEGIVGLLVMGSAPRLTIIEPTRHIYKWAKEHDCLWAFDRSVNLPESIVAWPGDRFLRQIRDRWESTDSEWGELPEPPPVEEEEVVLDEPILEAILDAVLKTITELPLAPIEGDEEADVVPSNPIEEPAPEDEPTLAPPEGILDPDGDGVIIIGPDGEIVIDIEIIGEGDPRFNVPDTEYEYWVK